MERLKTVSLFIFLILIAGCKGLDTASGRGPALSGVKNQKVDVVAPSTLTSLQQMIAQSFNDLQNKLEDRLSTLEHDLNDRIDSLDSKSENRISRLQNYLDTKTENRLSTLEHDLNDKIDSLDTNTENRISRLQSYLDTKTEDRLSTLEHDLNNRIDSLDTDTENRISRLQNFLDTKAISRIDTLDSQTENRFAILHNNLDYKIDTLDSKSEDRFSRLQDNIYDKIDKLENRIEDEFKFIDDKIQVNSNAGNSSFESKIDDKLRQLQAHLTNKTNACDIKLDDKMRSLQTHLEAKADVFENLLDIKLNTLQDKIDIKFDNQNISDRMILLEDKISNELEECRTDTKNDMFNHLETMLRRSDDTQSTNLENFSETIGDNMNKTFDYLIHIKRAFESCKLLGEIHSKNHTEEATDVQTSMGNSTLCLPKDVNTTVMDPLRSTCHRGMAYESTKKYQRLEVMRDNTLSRDILCDTETVGGGWIMIQRRIKGDVDFYRTWEEYKNGFGSPPGDFWLGNEAIHSLTSQGSYELRIDFNDGSQDLFAVYSSFQLEDETDNYRLWLGSHSGTLGKDSVSSGLSYHNGSQFSTHDKDNENYPKNCAELLHGAWWYRECATTNLNGEWGEQYYRGLSWHTGSIYIYASSTEMKIRLT